MSEPNRQLRAAREAAESPRVPGAAMNRHELADAANAWLHRHTDRPGALTEDYVAKLERGRVRWPGRDYRAALRAVLGATEDAALGFAPPHRRAVAPQALEPVTRRTGTDHAGYCAGDELRALELARRVAVSDIGDDTLALLEATVDELATAYPRTAPADLLPRIRTHLGYLDGLLDARATLAQRRRLFVVGGWLSLLAATVHVDLGQDVNAAARLRTAASLADHAEHHELRAWCHETAAWRALVDADYPRAVELSRAAQHAAPPGSSAAVQATAQEGRAHARLGDVGATHAALARVHALAAPMRRPDTPEHHYRYDPGKAVGYTATTLAWLGDPAAEDYAREVIARLAPDGTPQRWPRRVATAHLDLALTLLVTGELEEACAATLSALTSGRVVPSNHWRAREVVATAEARRLPGSDTLRDAYEQLRRTP